MSAPGHCKVCAGPLAKEINKRLTRGDTLTALATWCDGRDFPVTRQKLADHKQHITDPRSTFVEHARRNPEIHNGVTNDEFLQAVIDTAAVRATIDPDSITITHGLQAVQVREARKEKQVNVLMLLSKVFTGQVEHQPPPMIEGSWSPVEENE